MNNELLPTDEEPIKIINGDCFEVLKMLPDNCMSLVITDPPYGDNIGYGRSGKTILNNEDETINYKLLDVIYPKMKDNTSLYLFTNWKFEIKLRNYIENNTKFNIRMLIIMIKNNIGMGYSFRNQYELCLVIEKGVPKYNLGGFSNVYKVRHIKQDKTTHPHQKDEFFIQKIIKHSSKEGDLVFDPFLGSGTTAIACKQLNRKCLGIELEEKYVNMANNKLKQKVLF